MQEGNGAEHLAVNHMISGRLGSSDTCDINADCYTCKTEYTQKPKHCANTQKMVNIAQIYTHKKEEYKTVCILQKTLQNKMRT